MLPITELANNAAGKANVGGPHGMVERGREVHAAGVTCAGSRLPSGAPVGASGQGPAEEREGPKLAGPGREPRPWEQGTANDALGDRQGSTVGYLRDHVGLLASDAGDMAEMQSWDVLATLLEEQQQQQEQQ